jgi:hypothetical protein
VLDDAMDDTDVLDQGEGGNADDQPQGGAVDDDLRAAYDPSPIRVRPRRCGKAA